MAEMIVMEVLLCILIQNFIRSAQGLVSVPHNVSNSSQANKQFKVGILMEEKRHLLELDVKETISRFRQKEQWVSLEVNIGRVERGNSLDLVERACLQVEAGAVAIISLLPHNSALQSIVSNFGVPLLTLSPDDPGITSNMSLSFSPSSTSLAEAVKALVREDSEETMIVYWDPRDILPYLTISSDKADHVTFHDVRQVEQDAADFSVSKNVILSSCNKTTGLEFLEIAMLSGLLSPDNRVILPCLDLFYSDIKERYSRLGAEIVLLNLKTETKEPGLSLMSMLLHDSLHHLTTNLASLHMTNQIRPPGTNSCKAPKYWYDGKKLAEKIINSSFLGETSQVSLDKHGKRTDFDLDVIHVQFGRKVMEGIWSLEKGFFLSKLVKVGDVKKDDDQAEDNHTLVVATILCAPYTMKVRDTDNKDGLEYEGFAMDLIREVARLVGFNYTISIVDEYGIQEAGGNWSGIIGEVVSERADLAVADLTINTQREKVVDFSMPFLDLGISILFVSSHSKTINLFSFLDPLSTVVWTMMLVGGVAVSLTMFFIARISPFETAELDTDQGESPFLSFRHCLWFSASSWVQQGCDFLPRAISTRTIASFWWFFTLIMISSYTANLAAFLTIERMDSPISSVQELAKSDIRYGSISSGSTFTFFKHSSDPFYKKMWNKIDSCQDCLLESNEKGISKVLQDGGSYAFFMESTTIEYHTERNCELAKIGENLDSKSYGIAMKKGSFLRSRISSAIIRLRQEGVLDRLKTKWWREERGGGACEHEDQDPSGVEKLGIENLGGIFLVLLLGLVIGLIMAAVEIVWVNCKKKNLLI